MKMHLSSYSLATLQVFWRTAAAAAAAAANSDDTHTPRTDANSVMRSTNIIDWLQWRTCIVVD